MRLTSSCATGPTTRTRCGCGATSRSASTAGCRRYGPASPRIDDVRFRRGRRALLFRCLRRTPLAEASVVTEHDAPLAARRVHEAGADAELAQARDRSGEARVDREAGLGKRFGSRELAPHPAALPEVASDVDPGDGRDVDREHGHADEREEPR